MVMYLWTMVMTREQTGTFAGAFCQLRGFFGSKQLRANKDLVGDERRRLACVRRQE